MAVKTFQDFWTDYVGETKHSPPIEEGDFSWIDDVAYEYAKYIQELQIPICLNSAKIYSRLEPHKRGYPYAIVNQNPNREPKEVWITVKPESVLNCPRVLQ